MCLPAVALASTVVSTAAQAYGQIQAGRTNDRIAKSNAANLDLAAADALARGEQDGATIRQQFGQIVGQQRAGFSAANVDISRGSVANLTADTGGVGELEVLRTMNNAAREAYGLRSQAAMTRAEGTMAKRMSYLGAGATLLAGAGDTFGQLRKPYGGKSAPSFKYSN